MDGQVLIAGAGPTGLALALQLARRKIPFRIIEQASGPGQQSRAMGVHARTLEFYQQLGFAQEVVGAGIIMERFHLRVSGHEVAHFTIRNFGAGLSPFPFVLCFPQDDHERLLGRHLEQEGIHVEWNTALKSFEQDDSGVHAALEKDGGEERASFAYLCGCDGARSTVREVLHLGFPGGTYNQRFYVADAEIEHSDADMVISLDPSSLGLKLPVRSTGMQRLIGLVPVEFTDRDDLQFEHIQLSVERLVGVRVKSVHWFSTYHVHHRVTDHFQSGRCFVLGDAGHLHSPAGAQGMNTGIGDAVNLAWKLAQVLQGRADPSMLATYETERIAFARQLVATTDWAFQRMIAQGTVGQLTRSALVPTAASVLTRLPQVRRALFRTASQIKISYRDSALSAGVAGEVHAGDRLPWVASADNFAPLRSLDWQVHVYGEPHPALRQAVGDLAFPLHAFPWSRDAARAGLNQDAAYLVRRDGYVGLATAQQDPAALRGYAARLGLKAAA